MNLENPKITVIMPVYNSGKYIKEAIESVLNQTFEDFEFLIISDPSTDDSIDIIESFNDPRIKLIKNEQKLGIVKSLNIGIDLAKGKYIIRMDADDISRPKRFKRQVDFMDNNLSIGVCGSYNMLFGAVNGQIIKYPLSSTELKSLSLFGCCFAHPSVIIRKSLLDEHNFRYPESSGAEDYALWIKILKSTEFATIPDVLLLYRIHPDQASYSIQKTVIIYWQKYLFEQLGLYPSEEEIELHYNLCNSDFVNDVEFVKKSEQWFLKLLDFSKKNDFLSEKFVKNYIQKKWFDLYYQHTGNKIRNFVIYISSKVTKITGYKFSNLFRLLFENNKNGINNCKNAE
jgi:glycosyltransferase involved in cell wall biosynthesis